MSAEAQARYMARQLLLDPDGWYERRRKTSRKHAATHHPQHAAHRQVYRAVQKGVLTRADRCEKCDKQCRTEAAHTDYSKPLVVLWLCRQCHARMDLGRAD